ncbi:AraC family transcriptional regulator [Niabella drilacis]|uniref:AraC-type DNA-binding protein n=1 Tax=Niabella drilacis (strain DSM 25811 / CCM 8410 / CCUG 62505 / LMG 26954 / E90) TaxID=1285928 RepID=A0A1G7BS72_NIADE|nr:helix-turn-helix transcriptional regulator [Niabella drilacis]SDE29994.1 AraC-type DNA-binding protein [Niabella drilacis]
MRPQLLKVSNEPQRSFSVRQDLVPHINNKWHMHSELELIHIKSGEGTQFIGDSIRRFRSGDVILVGSHLPHYWKFDASFFEEVPSRITDVRVAHFSETFLGGQFLQLPENSGIRNLLERSRRGLQVFGKASHEVAAILEKLLTIEGSQRIILMLEALAILSEEKKCVQLSSIGFKPDGVTTDNERIQAVFDYSIKNFKRKIKLEEIADIANISPNSFCRFFKSRTRKTYSQFLIELRVGYACKLLIETNQCLKRLCFESGFNNFTSFHKYFKIITGKSPMVYQREFTA